jgi:acetoacetyl-CoA synthetase
MAGYMRWLEQNRGLTFGDYNKMWEWSVEDLDGFWSSIVEFFDLPLETKSETVLAKRAMPGAEWYPEATTNCAHMILRQAEKTPDAPALVTVSETFGRRELTWTQLRDQVASVAAHMRTLGIEQGDRVVSVLPNADASIIACVATMSIGAIWSQCAPDMGPVAILDRFVQIEPKLLITQNSYVHAGQNIDKTDVIQEIVANLPSLTHHIVVPTEATPMGNAINWDDLLGQDTTFAPVDVPFDHPLWIVYSSGTTGNPKPIVHGHGGVLLEAAKHSLHQNTRNTDRFCWMTSSGWIMWNTQLFNLAQGATVVQFDQAPNYPDMMAFWKFAEEERLTYLGVGAAFISVCVKAGITPNETYDYSNLHGFGTTGSPLSEEGYDWIYRAVKKDVWLAPISGGTDFAGAFVGGNPMMPVRAGEMQCRFLGNAVRAYDVEGNEVFGEVGELVCTEPLPSMPLYFWGDDDGRRLFESYYDTYPETWRHGDWIEITPHGGAVIYGRSDATINRRGLRLGSSEIYRMVEGVDEVLDSLVVDLEFLGKESFMPLFVVLAEGTSLDDAIKDKINTAISNGVSPRFLPNEIIEITEVPRTLSGKKLEVPVKKLLLGGDPEKVVNRDSMANPESFDQFIAYAAKRGS